MNDALDAGGRLLDAVLAWLRLPVTTTISRSELVFAPVVVVAFLFHLRNSVVMARLWFRLRRSGADGDLRASARERWYRAMRGMLRLSCWVLIVWALAVNWPYALAVFTLGILSYGLIEAADAGLDWLYQYQRARYWERRDAMDDYAEQVAALARNAAERAEAAAVAAVQQGERLEAKLDLNIGLTERAAAASAEAAEVANHMNNKLLRYGITETDAGDLIGPHDAQGDAP